MTTREKSAGAEHRHAEPPAADGVAAEWGHETVERAQSMLIDRVRRDPYATLGIAAGVGLLVGGGMWRLFARSVVGLGTRLAVGAIVATIFEEGGKHAPNVIHKKEA